MGYAKEQAQCVRYGRGREGAECGSGVRLCENSTTFKRVDFSLPTTNLHQIFQVFNVKVTLPMLAIDA